MSTGYTTPHNTTYKRLPAVQIQRKKVKHARLLVHHDGAVHFVVPERFSQNKINELLAKHSDWISKHLERFSKLERIELEHGEILYRGEAYRFQLKPQLEHIVELYSTQKVIASGVNLLHKKTLDNWYLREAERVILRRVKFLAERFGFTYNRIRITSPKTLWGSCSYKKDIMFNWRLIKAPAFVLDYIILHELVHTEILAHNRAFWNRVAEVCPRHEEAIEWLKTYGRWM
ncbi:MAG: SprT family zinc-dependent metalloprotease [Candidatus Kapaibacterium sp.]|nr:M48 family metallopeptidase [Bacteroidota bacterium]